MHREKNCLSVSKRKWEPGLGQLRGVWTAGESEHNNYETNHQDSWRMVCTENRRQITVLCALAYFGVCEHSGNSNPNWFNHLGSSPSLSHGHRFYSTLWTVHLSLKDAPAADFRDDTTFTSLCHRLWETSIIILDCILHFIPIFFLQITLLSPFSIFY